MAHLSKEEIEQINKEVEKTYVKKQLQAERKRVKEQAEKRLELYGDGSLIEKTAHFTGVMLKQGLGLTKKAVKK